MNGSLKACSARFCRASGPRRGQQTVWRWDNPHRRPCCPCLLSVSVRPFPSALLPAAPDDALFSYHFQGRPGQRHIDIVSSSLAHQNDFENRTIAIASDFCDDGVKSPEIPQKERVSGSEIAAPNRKSLATFHRTLKSQCSIALSSVRNHAMSGVCGGHRNRKSQKSLRFRCAKGLSTVTSCHIQRHSAAIAVERFAQGQ